MSVSPESEYTFTTSQSAFQVWGYGWITSGFVEFPSYAPYERTFLYDYGYYDGANTFRAGTFVEDTYYAFVANSYASKDNCFIIIVIGFMLGLLFILHKSVPFQPM